MSESVIHPLPPLFDANSRVLILGTMPSPKSRILLRASPKPLLARVGCRML